MAGGSLGQFIVLPLATLLLEWYQWSTSLIYLSIIASSMLLFALALNYSGKSKSSIEGTNQSLREKEFKLEQLRALDNDMKIVIDFIDDIPIGVDTEEDLYNVRKELE